MANGNYFIKFDPAVLLAASADLDRHYQNYKDCVSEIKVKTDALRVGWKGECAAEYADAIGGLEVQGVKFAEKLRLFGKSLADSSGIYKAGESAAKQKAEGLPTKGVFRI